MMKAGFKFLDKPILTLRVKEMEAVSLDDVRSGKTSAPKNVAKFIDFATLN